jgi:hypothetical protein
MEAELIQAFTDAIEVIHRCLGKLAFRPKAGLNAAVLDSVMVGIARRLNKTDIADCNAVKKQYKDLLSNPEFITATETATANEDYVKLRLKLATEAFSKVK